MKWQSFVKSGLAVSSSALLVFGVNAIGYAVDTSSAAPQVQSDRFTFTEQDVERVSEAFGHLIGKNLNTPGFTFNLESIIKGMKDAASGQEAPMSETEYEEMIARIQENAFLELADTNLHDAEKFLHDNAAAEGVQSIEDGKLQYKIIQTGAGEAVSANSSPLIHYTGKYLDGNTFGSSVDNGTPITLRLDQTIPGFSKGLLGMKEGEKRRLYIHPDLGYGTSGHLQPNSLLVFDIEVLKASAQSEEKAEPEQTLSLDTESSSPITH